MTRRIYFRLYMIHSCFDPELYAISEAVPDAALRRERFKEVMARHDKALRQECKCKYWVDGTEATELMELRLALPLVDDRGETPFLTRHLVVKLAVKTPRAHTIEKAHMERAVVDYSDGGAFQAILENEDFALIELYHDIEMEERLRLFGAEVGARLLKYKHISDKLGIVEGMAGKYANDIVQEKVNEIKAENCPLDAFEGDPVLAYIGLDQRTSIPITNERIGDVWLSKSEHT